MVPELAIERLTQKALDKLLARMAPAFSRIETRRKARAFVGLLLEPVARKNGWQLAERAGLKTPITLQKLLSTDKVDADLVRDAVRAAVLTALADEDAALILDETGFVKKGKQSVGVQRQYSGTAGKTENCQVAVFLAYASTKGHGLIDRALYLPKAWTDDPERRRKAGVPAGVDFATKPQLAIAMLEAAMAAGAKAAWLLGDAVYGVHSVMDAARQAGLGYVLGVTSQFSCGWASAQQTLEALGPDIWTRLSAGEGAKGERLFDWALVHEWPQAEAEGWTRKVVARRLIRDPEDVHFFVVRCPTAMSLEDIARLAGRRWIVEECFRTAKQKAGLADYEVRTWAAWHRHISFAMTAAAALMLAAVAAPKKSSAFLPRRGALPPTPSPGSSDRSPSPEDRLPSASP
jgi:SRSO17 transposase